MYTYESSVTVPAGRAAVWAAYADVAGWPRWDPSLTAARLTGPFRAGSRGEMTLAGGPTLAFVLTACDPAAGFTAEAQMDALTIACDHRLADVPGGVRVTHAVAVTGGPEPLAQAVGQSISAGIPEALRRLAAL